MRTSTKIRIDRWVGTPLALLLNISARILGAILRPNHKLEREYKTIVVAKYLGLGSVVQASALLRSLRTSHPNAKLVFVTNRAYRDLVVRTGLVDEILTVSDNGFLNLIGSTLGLIGSLWKRRPGLFIDLEIYSNFSTLVTTLSCARNRIGYYKESRHYRMGIYTHMMYFNIKAPISEVYLQMARVVGCSSIHEQLVAPKVTAEEMAKVNEDMGIHGPYVVVNPNASDLRVERRWPFSSYKQLIRQITEEHPGFQVVLIGSKDEASYVQGVIEGLASAQIVNTAGRLALAGLFAIIRGADLVVTNDSGPMNISLAYGKNTVGLFGPVAPEQYGSFKHCYPFYKNIYCSPCVHEFDVPPCKGDNQCMKTISVEEVFGTVGALLAGHVPPTRPAEGIAFTTEIPLGLVNRKRHES